MSILSTAYVIQNILAGKIVSRHVVLTSKIEGYFNCAGQLPVMATVLITSFSLLGRLHHVLSPKIFEPLSYLQSNAFSAISLQSIDISTFFIFVFLQKECYNTFCNKTPKEINKQSYFTN